VFKKSHLPIPVALVANESGIFLGRVEERERMSVWMRWLRRRVPMSRELRNDAQMLELSAQKDRATPLAISTTRIRC
jgi:hypothetical protein